MKRVAIVGGGLAGLAAAVGLTGRQLEVAVYEARRNLGGRAGSFRDPATGEQLDHCQHVALGCCTNFRDFCRRTELDESFVAYRTLHFLEPNGRRHDLTGLRSLPAPLHLAPALVRMGFLSWSERFSLARAMARLARELPADERELPAAAWLRRQGQSERAIERFWGPVLVSALGETLDRAIIGYARKVFVDGFLAHRDAFEVRVPREPLGRLFGPRVEAWLEARGVAVHKGRGAARIAHRDGHLAGLELADGTLAPADAVIAAVPWRRLAALSDEASGPRLAAVAQAARIEGSPITALHLWFDRPLTDLPHAVFVGTLVQWVFAHGTARPGGAAAGDAPAAHYYQVVISGSADLTGRPREEVRDAVLRELRQVWPAAREARLLHDRTVTEPAAVFSARAGIDALRPAQTTEAAGVFLAGDWTATGWPATMEGAVRSGYLAAEALLASWGQPARLVVPDLPREWPARWLLGLRAE